MELKQEDKLIKKPSGWGARHTFAALGFVGFALSYAMRFNLSMAIVAMVNSSATASPAILSTAQYECPSDNKVDPWDASLMSNLSSASMNVSRSAEALMADDDGWTFVGEFNWDEEEQGIILGCFFFGYLVTQMPGGILGQRFGGKWPLGIGLLVTAIFTLLTPAAAYLGKEALIAVRVLQGVGEGVTMPCMHALLSKWAPVQERSMLSAIVYAGMNFGSSATMLISGCIIHYLGWPSVFYACGGCTVIWFVLWAFLVSNKPADHPTISHEELEYITMSLSSACSTDKKGIPSVPWKLVLLSGPFWGILLCQTLEGWGSYTLLHETPTYMQNVLHFDMRLTSIFSAIPHLMAWFVAISITQIADRLIERKFVSVVVVRKTCNTIGLWGAAVALVGVGYSGCNHIATPILLTMAVGCYGALLGGVIINLIDIAPNYACILMGIVNTFANLSGFAAPWLAGYILKGNPSMENWRTVFLVAAGICFMANLMYILLASGSPEKWNQGANEAADVSADTSFSWIHESSSSYLTASKNGTHETNTQCYAGNPLTAAIDLGVNFPN